MLVPHELYFQMSRASAKLHHENWGSDHFCADLLPARFELLVVGAFSDALATAALGGLEHDGVADPANASQRLLVALQASGLEGLLRDAAVRLDFRGNSIAIPRDAGHLRRLRQDRRGDFVSESVHHRSSGAKEGDAQLGQGEGQSGILRGMPPTGPDAIDALLFRDLNDQVHVRVVKGVLSRRHLHIRVGQPNELSIRL
mmetsp:Transcript_95182/g.199017  ORF Transcript_95182/g.199017 Transcript_95182/m.199017 type:complete len:200 (+) Transcript_95182:5247-5846(+)